MTEVRIVFTQADGVEKTIADGAIGESLMELARDNGVEGILGDCGGGCSCATCHVFVDPEWMDIVGEADDIEKMTLDMVSDTCKPNSRLSCQIRVREDMDGLRLTVAPIE